MRGARIPGLATAIAALSTTTPTAAAEALQPAIPPGYRIGFEATQGRMVMQELVKPPETVEGWTKLITLQTFRGGVSIAPEDMLGRIAIGFANACPGMQQDPIRRETINGYPNAFLAIRCPRNPQTSKPENVIFRAIWGNANAYVAQVAVRYQASASETEADRRYLRGVTVCDPATKAHPCAAVRR